MDLAIVVIAYKRPKYLYVTLDALFRVKGIKNYGIFLAVDGEGGKENEIKEVASNFDLDGFFIRPRHFDNLDHLVYSMKIGFNLGYEHVMFLEDDILIRPDALEFVESAPRDYFFLNLCGHGSKVGCLYRSFANVINRENFKVLFDYVTNRCYVGKKRFKSEKEMTLETTGHDAVFTVFVKNNNIMVRFSDKPYVAHFGIVGRNLQRFRLKRNPEEARLEQEIFRGKRCEWLGNAIRVFEENENRRLIPRDFKYET